MKRFWKQAQAVERDGGWGVELDGKPLRTPAREPLIVPTKALAEAIAAEWNGVEDKIDPGAMPLTGLANAAVDRVAPDKEAFAQGVGALRGGRSRLLPRRRAAARSSSGRPSCGTRCSAGAGGASTSTSGRRAGIVHVDQPAATIDRLAMR